MTQAVPKPGDEKRKPAPFFTQKTLGSVENPFWSDPANVGLVRITLIVAIVAMVVIMLGALIGLVLGIISLCKK